MEDGMTSVITTNGINGDTAKEIIEIGAKTVLSAIPIGGALMSGVWDSVKSRAAQRRLELWQDLIEERIRSLEVTLQEIGENENFATALFQATELALKTSEDKKREYLANAVLNSATCEIEESIITIYLNLVGTYSLWHIKILEYLDNPSNYKQFFNSSVCMGSPIIFLMASFPELEGKREFVNKIIKDLFSDGMTTTESMGTMMTYDGMIASRTSELGKGFIAFLSRH